MGGARFPAVRLFAVAALIGGVCGGAGLYLTGARAPEPVAKGVPIALHQAIYHMASSSVLSGAGLVGVRGSMYFKQDETCVDWTTDQRFALEYQYPERQPVNNVTHYVASESKDGARLDFSSTRQENGRTTEDLRGSVMRTGLSANRAVYARPEGLAFDLPAGFAFPVAHTAQIVRHARAGDTMYSAVMFDGTDSEGPSRIVIFIGKPATAAEVQALLPASGIDMSLVSVPGWHIRMAVFPLSEEGDAVPSYEMDMILHENGVVSHAVADYQTFRIEQTLTAAERLPAQACP